MYFHFYSFIFYIYIIYIIYCFIISFNFPIFFQFSNCFLISSFISTLLEMGITLSLRELETWWWFRKSTECLQLCLSPIREGSAPFFECCITENHTFRSMVNGHSRNNNWVTSPQSTYTGKQYGAQHLERYRERQRRRTVTYIEH